MSLDVRFPAGRLMYSGIRRFTGIEFAVVHAQPPTFFIIQKRNRLSPDEGTRRFIDCLLNLTMG